MAKKLSKTKTDKFDKILKESSIDEHIKQGKLAKGERQELKAHAIKKAVKIKRYVRN